MDFEEIWEEIIQIVSISEVIIRFCNCIDCQSTSRGWVMMAWDTRHGHETI
jgi:hypothetical protein